MMRVEFRLLGPLEVVEHDRPVAIGGGKQRALMAILLLRANEVVSTERLIDELWGESPPSTAVTALHGYVSRLRKLLGAERVQTRLPMGTSEATSITPITSLPPAYATAMDPDGAAPSDP